MWRICKQSCGRDAHAQCSVVEAGLELDDHIEIFFGRSSHRANKICGSLCARGVVVCSFGLAVQEEEEESTDYMRYRISLPVYRSLYTARQPSALHLPSLPVQSIHQ